MFMQAGDIRCMARELKWSSAQAEEQQALGAARDKIVRNKSVANDIRLNLPVSIQRPEGRLPFPSGYDSVITLLTC
jgi:hypothetical protein